MASRDDGKTWAMLPGFPPNYYVTAILETEQGSLVVSSQSHLWNATDGGIWHGSPPTVGVAVGATGAGVSGGSWDWTRVSTRPTFTLLQLPMNEGVPGGLLATHARLPQHTVSISLDHGSTWTDLAGAGGPMGWKDGAVPFYTCAAVVGESLVVAGLTNQRDNVSATDSAFFVRPLPVRAGDGWTPLAQPTAMDEDAMPKDRMAVLGDPAAQGLMYVAGNAGALAWRVNISAGVWTKMWDTPDVLDGSEAHGDCRNYAWDSAYPGGRLVLVSDGGIFARLRPRQPGGKWVSLNGDIKAMEYLSAHYDNRADRFVAGAQDNAAQVFAPHAGPDAVAVGFVDGDGTVTLVDNVHNPSRLYGTTQFMGVGTIDIDPSEEGEDEEDGDGDDDDCGGLCFVQGDQFIEVPLDTYFPEPSSFPFFVQPYALNSQDPTQLVFWANGTAKRPSAFYAFSIPAGVRSKKDIAAPKLVLESPPGSFFLDFVSGGFTQGKPDPTLLVGMDNANLYVRNAGTGGKMVTRPLPAVFAVPVTLSYDPTNDGARILGPLSHGATVSMSVSPANSDVITVTGWPSVLTNLGQEQVFVTADGGQTWINATGNMREASGVTGKVRPGGLLVVDLEANSDIALLVSTTNGVLVSSLGGWVKGTGAWTRLGTCTDFPIVLNAGLSYEHYSDTLVAATMGRGVYTLHSTKAELLKALAIDDAVPERSSAMYFPKQH